MKIDMAEIFRYEGKLLDIDEAVDLSSLTWQNETPFYDTRVTGRIQNRSGVVSFKAEVSLTVKTACARCLKEISVPRSFVIDEILVTRLDNSELDGNGYTVVADKTLDLDELVSSVVILGIDMIFLCREECLGLCPVCGRDLNHETCDCGSGK